MPLVAKACYLFYQFDIQLKLKLKVGVYAANIGETLIMST